MPTRRSRARSRPREHEDVLVTLSRIQSANNEYAEMLETLDVLQRNSVPTRQLYNDSGSNRNLALNRAYALQNLGRRTEAEKLLRQGFEFKYPRIQKALEVSLK